MGLSAIELMIVLQMIWMMPGIHSIRTIKHLDEREWLLRLNARLLRHLPISAQRKHDPVRMCLAVIWSVCPILRRPHAVDCSKMARETQIHPRFGIWVIVSCWKVTRDDFGKKIWKKIKKIIKFASSLVAAGCLHNDVINGTEWQTICCFFLFFYFFFNI